MAVSDKTKTVLERTLVRDVDDLYPDRTATPAADGSFPIRQVDTSTYRHGDEVPTTTKDMHRLYMWQYDEEVYGTYAKKEKAQKRYRRDISRAQNKQEEYKDIYIDTFVQKKLVSKQLEEFD